MFSADRIQKILETELPDCTAIVRDDANDGEHFSAEVYAALGDHMRSDIHALALKTYTPDRWPH